MAAPVAAPSAVDVVLGRRVLGMDDVRTMSMMAKCLCFEMNHWDPNDPWEHCPAHGSMAFANAIAVEVLQSREAAVQGMFRGYRFRIAELEAENKRLERYEMAVLAHPKAERNKGWGE